MLYFVRGFTTRSIRQYVRLRHSTFDGNIKSILSKIFQPDRFDKVAVINSDGSIFSYRDLDLASSKLASHVKSHHFRKGKLQKTCASYYEPSMQYVVALMATWKLGMRFLPLSTLHPVQELKYFINDSNVDFIFHGNSHLTTLGSLQGTHIFLEPFLDPVHGKVSESATNEQIDSSPIDDALVLYTSGTTGQPKGVVHTFNGIASMIQALASEWEYSQDDKILHFLPLHHLHGVLNKLLCVLWAGGTIEFLQSSSAANIWTRLAVEESNPSTNPSHITIFMAVPTVYAKLIEHANKVKRGANKTEQEALQKALFATRRMRLMVCGSAALPDTVLDAWKDLTGHTLLERYGMTELGMALSNPYRGIRRKGYVGRPLQGVECRLVDDNENNVTVADTPGELRVKGPCVFKEYLGRPKATAETFDADGWFKTGDVAIVSLEGDYKLLGRSSADIIKSSGFKLSALEIEREILAHPQVLEVAVVGVADEILGEKVVAVIALRDDADIAIDAEASTAAGHPPRLTHETETAEAALRSFLADRLALYKQPRCVVIVPSIPRNHLGKVNKKSLKTELKL